MKISVCIPMYNEGAVIEKTARVLDEYMRKNFSAGDYEIIFADGREEGNVCCLFLPGFYSHFCLYSC